MRLATLPSLLLLAVACVPTPPLETLSCTTDNDCAAGHFCERSGADAARCVALDGGAAVPVDAAVPDDAGPSADAGLPVTDAGHDAGGPVDVDPGDAGAIDAGPLEPADGGPVDVDPADAGVHDGGVNESEADWPAPGWSYRRRLTLVAPDEDVAADAPIRVSLGDTNALMNDERALASGDDLRIWHFDGRRWRERDRVLAEAGNGGGFRGDSAGAPLVMIRAARAIEQGGSDAGYWLYYGNDSAGAPPTRGVPARRSLLAHSSLMTTTSATLVDVTSLTVQPSAHGEVWVVVATWQQLYTAEQHTFVGPAGGVQLVVDGAPLVSGALQSALVASSSWHAGVAMTVLGTAPEAAEPGTSLPSYEVGLRLAVPSTNDVAVSSASIRDARVLAFVVPTRGNEVLRSAQLGRQTLVGDLGSGLRVSAWSWQIPAQPTDAHLWLGHNLVHEWPGVAAGLIELSFDDVVVRSSEESWLGDPLFHSLFQASVVSLAAPHSAKLEYVASTGAGSEVAGITHAFLPLEGFAYGHITGASQSTTALVPTQVLSLNIPATSLEHEYLYLGVVGSTYDANDSVTEVTTVSVERAEAESLPLGRSEHAMDRDKSYVVSVGIGARELRSSAAKLRVLAHTSLVTVPARVESPFLMWLRYPEVSTGEGAQEAAP